MSGGKIDKMTAMKENSTLVIDLVTNDNGNLTLELPRNIMDSKNPQNEDEDYVIFADGLQIGRIRLLPTIRYGLYLLILTMGWNR